MLNDALVIEMVINFLVKASKTLARNVLIEKNKDMGSEKNIPLDFTECISYSKVQKKSKVVNV